MKLMLSGEGPTDIGTNQPIDGGTKFFPGPMAELIDHICRNALTYSLLEMQRNYPETNTVQYLDRGDLSHRKQQRQNRPLLLGGHRRPSGLAGASAQAWMLGRLAAEHTEHDLVVAILFHDSDGTRAVPRNQWQSLVDAINDGFRLANFPSGVAMVPRPKSEAWLLCALKSSSPYQHCEQLEEAPGNDNSPHSLKNQLAECNAGTYPSAEEQADWVRDGRIDPAQINMPSFKRFTKQLTDALTQVTSHTEAPQQPRPPDL